MLMAVVVRCGQLGYPWAVLCCALNCCCRLAGNPHPHAGPTSLEACLACGADGGMVFSGQPGLCAVLAPIEHRLPPPSCINDDRHRVSMCVCVNVPYWIDCGSQSDTAGPVVPRRQLTGGEYGLQPPCVDLMQQPASIISCTYRAMLSTEGRTILRWGCWLHLFLSIDVATTQSGCSARLSEVLWPSHGMRVSTLMCHSFPSCWWLLGRYYFLVYCPTVIGARKAAEPLPSGRSYSCTALGLGTSSHTAFMPLYINGMSIVLYQGDKHECAAGASAVISPRLSAASLAGEPLCEPSHLRPSQLQKLQLQMRMGGCLGTSFFETDMTCKLPSKWPGAMHQSEQTRPLKPSKMRSILVVAALCVLAVLATAAWADGHAGLRFADWARVSEGTSRARTLNDYEKADVKRLCLRESKFSNCQVGGCTGVTRCSGGGCSNCDTHYWAQ